MLGCQCDDQLWGSGRGAIAVYLQWHPEKPPRKTALSFSTLIPQKLFFAIWGLCWYNFFSPWTAWNARNWSLDLRLLPLRSWGCRWAGMWAGVIGHTKCPVLPWCRCLDFLLHKFRQKPWSYFMLQDEKQEKEEKEEAKKLLLLLLVTMLMVMVVIWMLIGCCWHFCVWPFYCTLLQHQKHSEVSHVRGQLPMKVPGLQLYLVFVGQC